MSLSCHTILSPVTFFEKGLDKPQLRELDKCFPRIKASRSSSAGEGSSEGKSLGQMGGHNRGLETQRSIKEMGPASLPPLPCPLILLSPHLLHWPWLCDEGGRTYQDTWELQGWGES